METNWQQIAEWVGLLGGVLVGVRILWHVLVKAYRRLGNNMFGIGDLKTDLAALSQQVEFVVSELKPNGGASVRDCLNRIELRQLLSDQRQWAIFADMSMGVFETNAEGGFLRVNRKYLRITGRSLEEVKGSGWVNTIAAQDRSRVEHEWAQAIEEGREFETEFILVTPDNDRVQVIARTYRLADDEGTLHGFLGMLTPRDKKGQTL